VEANDAIVMQAQDAATPAADISGGLSKYSGVSNGGVVEQIGSIDNAPPIERQESQPPRAICLSENKMLDILDSGRDNVRLILACLTEAPLIYSYVPVPDRCSRCLTKSTKSSQGCSALKQEYHSSARQC
jgi:hypothetical protein